MVRLGLCHQACLMVPDRHPGWHEPACWRASDGALGTGVRVPEQEQQGHALPQPTIQGDERIPGVHWQ